MYARVYVAFGCFDSVFSLFLFFFRGVDSGMSLTLVRVGLILLTWLFCAQGHQSQLEVRLHVFVVRTCIIPCSPLAKDKLMELRELNRRIADEEAALHNIGPSCTGDISTTQSSGVNTTGDLLPLMASFRTKVRTSLARPVSLS